MNTAEDAENVSFWLLGFVRENSVDVEVLELSVRVGRLNTLKRLPDE
jgi:hypothetical protein